jgi:flotillin
MEAILIFLGVILFIIVVGIMGLRGMFYTCPPSEVLIFSGRRAVREGRRLGYRLIKGGSGFRIPLLERVDRLDLTNIIIDIQAQNAYSKGGIPLHVQGVANVKIAGHEPLMNNAIERFLGKSRQEVMMIAKGTLEGSLRGILATMTPEEVNEDKLLFAERLVADVEQDMTSLGLVVDTMKIQNVQDDVKYLDSIGRRRNAEIVSRARIAEANAHADSIVRSAENLQRETEAQITAQIEIAKADAHRRLTDAQTRRAALVAEEQAQVMALVAQAQAEVQVQKARVEQIRRKLDADVIQPAKAAAEAMEADAKASTAAIVEDGKARAEALQKIAETWRKAGPNAREVLLAQKLDSVIAAMTLVIPETDIEKVTMIGGGSGSGSLPGKALGTLEQIKQIFGIDVVEKINQLGGDGKGKQSEPRPESKPEPQVQAAPQPEPKPEVRRSPQTPRPPMQPSPTPPPEPNPSPPPPKIIRTRIEPDFES